MDEKLRHNNWGAHLVLERNSTPLVSDIVRQSTGPMMYLFTALFGISCFYQFHLPATMTLS